MFVSSSRSLPTARELNIASYVLLQNGRYIFEALTFFDNLQKIYSHGFYSKSRLTTVRTQSDHLGWDATLRISFLRNRVTLLGFKYIFA